MFQVHGTMLVHKKFSFGILPASYNLHNPPDKNIHTANKSQNRKGQDQLDLFFLLRLYNNNNRKVVVGGYFIRPLLPGFYVLTYERKTNNHEFHVVWTFNMKIWYAFLQFLHGDFFWRY